MSTRRDWLLLSAALRRARDECGSAPIMRMGVYVAACAVGRDLQAQARQTGKLEFDRDRFMRDAGFEGEGGEL